MECLHFVRLPRRQYCPTKLFLPQFYIGNKTFRPFNHKADPEASVSQEYPSDEATTARKADLHKSIIGAMLWTPSCIEVDGIETKNEITYPGKAVFAPAKR